MSMRLLDDMERDGFEQVLLLHEPQSGLRACLGLHNTRRGPAFGGIRRFSYLDEDAAVRDCLRLACAMSYKCALFGLPAGGGKLVVLDHQALDLERAYRHIGDVVEDLGGRFYTGPDVGTGPRELAWVASRTGYVTHPGPEGPGELASATCAGVLAGMEAALCALDGEADWPARTVVVQGLGDVGAGVARLLAERGARVLAAEIDAERAAGLAAELDLELIDPALDLRQPCDLLAPCALGGILHDLTIEKLSCRIVAGAANNILARPEHADRLHARGILYVPDFVINSGALIRGATFHLEGRREPIEAIGSRVGRVAERILALSLARGEPPARVAWREARDILERAHEPRRPRS
jgi:leucine dehydrogenase